VRIQHPHQIHKIREDGAFLDVLEQLEVLIAVVVQCPKEAPGHRGGILRYPDMQLGGRQEGLERSFPLVGCEGEREFENHVQDFPSIKRTGVALDLPDDEYSESVRNYRGRT
jgi:hypothetical protein